MREAVLFIASLLCSGAQPLLSESHQQNIAVQVCDEIGKYQRLHCLGSENAAVDAMLPDLEVTAPLRGPAPLRLVAQLCLGNGTECAAPGGGGGGGGGSQGGRAVSPGG